MPKSKRTTFVVLGRGTFPFDMLRYDQAWPTDRGSGSLSHLASLRGEPGGYAERVQVELQSDSPPAPTIGRWNSFGWAVESVNGVPKF